MARLRRGTIINDIAVTKLGHGGVGIGSHPDVAKKIVVKGGALPSSRVTGRVTKVKRGYIEVMTEQIEVEEQAASIVDTACIRCAHYHFPLAGRDDPDPARVGCGGCKRQAIPYTHQCDLKNNIIRDTLYPIADLVEPIGWPTIHPSPMDYEYRNKIEFSFGTFLRRGDAGPGEFAIEERWQLGFHKQGEFAKIVDVERCHLIPPSMHALYERTKELCRASGLPVYDQKIHAGVLRHLMIREGVHTDQRMLVVSYHAANCTANPDWHQAREALCEQLRTDDLITSQAHTVCLIANDGKADILGGRDAVLTTLWGPGMITEQLTVGGETLTFGIRPFAFFQTNTRAAELLYQTAFDTLRSATGGERYDTVIDLYCGTGTIGQCAIAAGMARRTIGVEIVQAAVDDANDNAARNDLADRCTYICGKAEAVVNDSLLTDVGCIIIDPPRDGCHPDVIKRLIATKKNNPHIDLLYISCNPITFVRDVQLLVAGEVVDDEPTGAGAYRLKLIDAVDMFPQTHHIEMIGVLR